MSNPNHTLKRLRPVHGAALVLAGVALVASACSSSGGSSKPTDPASSAPASQSQASSSSAAPSSTAPTTPDATPVAMKTLNSDGVTYGVGMPVIVYFDKKPTDAKQFQADTKVTANGKALTANWYFEYSSANKGFPVEAHLRPQTYWPAHSDIHVDFPKSGVSLGKGLELRTKLTSLDFKIGARHITTVDDSNNTVTVVSDGKRWGQFKTSLGANDTRTKRGIKVIMEKGLDISMKGPGYFEPHVKYTQRLTYSGEYLHQAEWNIRNIDNGVNSSNGCTNLLPADAKKLYGFLRVGDPVEYPNANGSQMQLGQGYGDWNLSWGEWQTGGLVPTQ